MAVKLVEKLKILFSSDWNSISIVLSQLHSGLLLDEGWFHSYKLKKAVDKNLKPIPWTTYSFLDFIKPRLNNSITIFEFGAGNSTYFFAEKVKSVCAVEHNESWYNEIISTSIQNVSLILKTDSVQYAKSVIEAKESYDLIFVDGIERNDCIKFAIKALTEKGMIILDDSEREEYRSGINELMNSGFRSIEFWGIAPGVLFKKCTTVFYKDNNCLGI